MSITVSSPLVLQPYPWRNPRSRDGYPDGLIVGRRDVTGDATGGSVSCNFTLPVAQFARWLLSFEAFGLRGDAAVALIGDFRIAVTYSGVRGESGFPFFEARQGGNTYLTITIPNGADMLAPFPVGGGLPLAAGTADPATLLTLQASVNDLAEIYYFNVWGYIWSVDRLRRALTGPVKP